MANSQRRRRVEQEIHRILSELIRFAVKDPRVNMVTISAVEVTQDFDLAKIFYTSLTPEAEREIIANGLSSAAGFLRSELGKRLKIHNIPELRFTYDTSIERGMRLSELIEQAVSTPSSARNS